METPKWKTTRCHRNQASKEQRERYYNSHLWKRTKAKILARDNHKCQICGNRGLLHVHHLTYDRFSNENDSDLITLCPDCHDLVHYFGDKAEYLLPNVTEYQTHITLMNAVPLVINEISKEKLALFLEFGKYEMERFFKICALTMLGEPFKLDWFNIIPVNEELQKIW